MSILGSIFSKILGHHGTATADASPGSTAAAPSAAPSQPTLIPTPVSDPAPVPPSASSPTPAPSATASAPAVSAPVDVAAMLDGLASKSTQKFDWQHSIVDMMKLLGLDSSLANRQALAKELAYTGDLHDSASMNIWLHKEVMTKLAENGGQVPADLRV